MRAQSPKRRREDNLRAELRRNLFSQCDGRCLLRLPPCTGMAEGLHERRKASAGGSRLSAQNCVPACNPCNGWIEDNPAAAAVRRAVDGRSLVVREGHPEWSFLGRRSA